MFNEAFEANKTLESLNLESNDHTNETIVVILNCIYYFNYKIFVLCWFQ